ncbi:hypothetical protein IW261DRAFT_1461017 [Armillaria novae-zelandiae]|uniref:Uncharacterized protein n=1 Tax=Armillaria novae-zelandiae TaxID=153914 RepID=A0AA39PIZ2_9AGAR|nr:hypothetical protein IW261DRAFT_1461017 [Armillaria novae-zelandiae]
MSLHGLAFNHPLTLAPTNTTASVAYDFGDYELRYGDENDLRSQYRFKFQVEDLERVARFATYHSTMCAYLTVFIVLVAFFKDIPRASIMTTPFGVLSATSLLFNTAAACMSFAITHKLRCIHIEFPLRRTYQVPEPSWNLHYMHYLVRHRYRMHFIVAFIIGSACVMFQFLSLIRMQQSYQATQIAEIKSQIEYLRTIIALRKPSGDRITPLTSLTTGTHPFYHPMATATM